MRFLTFSALGLLCLTGCNNDSNSFASDSFASGPVSTGNAVPVIHVRNATDTTHQVEVEYDHGIKILKIGEGANFRFHFNPKSNFGREVVNTYDVTVYEYDSQERKCSTVISVASSGEFTPLAAETRAGKARCTATTPSTDDCRVKAGAFGPTCHVEVAIVGTSAR